MTEIELDPRADFSHFASDPDFDAESGSAGVQLSAEMEIAQMHLELGGALELRRGVVTPASYGDDPAEDGALRSGWTLRHRMGQEVLEMRGEDRLRFLNAQATCEVKDLAAGEGVFGFFVGAKGRIEADVDVLAFADRLWLVLPPGRAEPIAARLEKYKVVDRVEIASLDRTSLAVAGPLAAERLQTLLGDVTLPESELDHLETTLSGVPVRLVREAAIEYGGRSIDSFALWLEPEQVEPLIDRLLDQNQGPTLIGWRAWDQLRVEAGWSLYGLDYAQDGAEDAFPQETGHGDRGVSYTKGCYLGQEVVARIHYRGGVQRRLVRLALDGRSKTGRELHQGGRKVGTLGTVTRLPSDDWAALAIVHQKAETGARLDVVDAETGEATGVSATLED